LFAHFLVAYFEVEILTVAKPLPKKMIFAAHYVKLRNATKAAKLAGFSEATAYSAGCRLLKDVDVQKYIAENTAKVIEIANVDAARVLKEIHLAAFLDPNEMYKPDGTLKNVPDMPEHIRRAIAGIEVTELWEGSGKNRRWVGYTKKVKLVSKEGTLTLAARNLGMLHDNVKIEDNGLVDKLTKGVARANKVKK
jgi:phage terminase small subunit